MTSRKVQRFLNKEFPTPVSMDWKKELMLTLDNAK